MTMVARTVVLAFLSWCFVTIGAAAESDSALRSRLVGTWEESRTVDNETHNQRITLRKDGSFEVQGTLREGQKKPEPFVFRGIWTVQNGKFLYMANYSMPSTALPVGESFADTIISVSDTEWVMIEQSTGQKSRARRVK